MKVSGSTPENNLAEDYASVIDFRRRPVQKKVGHTCVCGSTWRPGFSSDPAWLLTAHPDWRLLEGVLNCQTCGRKKLDVFREQAEQRRAIAPSAIPPREREAARVIPLRQTTADPTAVKD